MGFTIVELLIVIVVIGILSTIMIVTYTGIQDRARDTSQAVAASHWQRYLVTYAQLNKGQLPDMEGHDTICLGRNYPNDPEFGTGCIIYGGYGAGGVVLPSFMDKIEKYGKVSEGTLFKTGIQATHEGETIQVTTRGMVLMERDKAGEYDDTDGGGTPKEYVLVWGIEGEPCPGGHFYRDIDTEGISSTGSLCETILPL